MRAGPTHGRRRPVCTTSCRSSREHFSHVTEADCSRCRLRSGTSWTNTGQPVHRRPWLRGTVVPASTTGRIRSGTRPDGRPRRRISHGVPIIAPPDDRPHPRAVDDGAELGALGRPLRARRLSSHRPQLARNGGRHRRASPRPFGDRPHRSRRDRRSLRRDHSRARRAADHHGPLVRWGIHRGPARPWARCSGRRHRLPRPVKGILSLPFSAAPIGVPRPEEPRQLWPSGRPDARRVPLRLREHTVRRGFEGCIRAVRRTGSGACPLPGRSCELQPTRRDEGRLPATRTAPRC